ncbi:MAG: lysylphosphatidylglycerol synthase domain-containing protein [Acidilobus sp.]
MGSLGVRFTQLFWGLILIALILAIFYILTGSLSEIGFLLASHPLQITFASGLLAVEEAIKSQRFREAARAFGRKIKPSQALKLHFASFGVGIITPAFSGGLPTMTAMLGDLLELSPSEALGIALSVTFFDSVIPAIVSMAISFTLLPFSVPIALMSVGVLLLWGVMLGSQWINCAVKRFAEVLDSDRVRRYIEGEASSLRPILLHILSKRGAFLTLFLISVISYILEASSILVLMEMDPTQYLQALGALMLSYVGGNLPTPGGVGGVEYALSLMIPRGVVVMWRVSYFLVGLAALVLLRDVVAHYIGYTRKIRATLVENH